MTGSLVSEREYHTATLLPSGKVLVAGGYNSSSSYLSSAEIYDPATERWSPTRSLVAHARQLHTATLLPSGKVLVAGGQNSRNIYLSSAELYDPAGGPRATPGPTPPPRPWLWSPLIGFRCNQFPARLRGA